MVYCEAASAGSTVGVNSSDEPSVKFMSSLAKVILLTVTATTCTVQLFSTSPIVAVMTASPIAFAVMTPFLFTVATSVLEELKLAEAVAYSGTKAVMLNVFVPPMFIVVSVSERVKSVMVGTVIVNV